MMNLQSSTRFSTSLVLATLAIGLCQAPPAFAAHPAPCAANPHSRQLDFWLGDWTSSAPGSAHAVSTVSLALDQCMVIESWDGGRGHKGENIFAYSPDDKSWHGMFADNEGRVHVFLNGKVSSGSAEFSGPSRGPDGQAVLNRVRIVGLGPGKAEQVWQKSTDNGTTWSTEFRGEYSRRNP
jgi:hypothetical protein